MTQWKITIFVFTLTPIFLLFLCSGCESKFTRDRWETIQVGSADQSEVEMILGKPDEKPMKDLWMYYKGNKTAKIYFDEKDIVKAKKWIDGKDFEVTTEPKGWDDR